MPVSERNCDALRIPTHGIKKAPTRLSLSLSLSLPARPYCELIRTNFPHPPHPPHPSSSVADKVHAFLRTVLARLYDEEVAQSVRIQYGGSVTPDSVDELMSQPEIDGCLVGGASLVAESFGRIVNYERK
jgi:hypothetical protein